MRTRLLLLAALLAVTFFANVAAAGNIAHGVKVVVIDPGHGGRFPGAHYGGMYEKDLVLKVALKLGAMIEEQMPGVKVVYTRKTDKALGEDLATDLQARADIANKADGDIFISIHANAARSSAARGVETLIMGESSKEQRYNESALFDNNREDLIDMSDQRTAAIVRAYIQNLQFTYGEYSMTMARCIQSNYQKNNRHSRGVKPQLLRVLYATDMPGVLTEIGFMSNPQEMALMKSDKGQTAIAQSLFAAVKEYSNHLQGVRSASGEQPAPQADTTREVTDKEVSADSGVVAPEASESKPVKASKSETAKPAKSEPVKPVKQETLKSEPVKTEPAKTAGKNEAVCYVVQVLASTKAVALNSAQFKTFRGKVTQYTSEGTFRYKYGVYESADRTQAQKKVAEVRKVFPGAFVVKCQGGKIVK